MRVIIPACKKYYWLLRSMSYLFNVYWSGLQPVTIFGYEPLEFELPPNFEFQSLASESYPYNKWTDGLIESLDRLSDKYVILFLEDYWLYRTVDHAGIASLESYMDAHPDVLRMDLTGDRLYSTKAYDIGFWGHLDLIETSPDTPYQISTQAAIWNVQHLRDTLWYGATAAEFELQGREHMRPGLRIQGTRQVPVRYTNAWGTGWAGPGPNLRYIEPHHVEVMRAAGWFDG